MVGFSHGAGVYTREWNLPKRVGSFQDSVVGGPGHGGVTVSTVEMLDLGRTLGREHSEGNRELID